MMSRAAQFLAERLGGKPVRIGQVIVQTGFLIVHADDVGKSGLEIFSDPYDALEISRYDDVQRYRALKTAPDLRHGWQLNLQTLDEVVMALDFLYPAALAMAAAFERDELIPVYLRQTLARQSGMYAVVAKLDDNQAREVIASTCGGTPGCLRRILWPMAPGVSSPCSKAVSSLPEEDIPLWCAEACNVLVAAGRKMLKG